VTATGELVSCEECATERMLGAQLRSLSLDEWHAPDAVRAALERYGLADARVGKTAQSPSSQPRAHIWEIEANGRRLILKRYHAWLDEEAITYEQRVLAYLDGKRFPVAAPLPAPDGATWVQIEGACWALFPALEGQHAVGQDWMWRITKAGATLAPLHQALREFTPAGRPDPAWDAWSVERLEALIGSWPHLPPLALDLIGSVRAHLAAKFFGGVYEALPRTIVHGEFNSTNLLWRADAVTGVLDWERAHRDTPLYDFATGIGTRWPPMLRGVLATYCQTAPLSVEERTALPEALLLGALVALDTQLTRSHNAQEATPQLQELAFMWRDVEALRKAALNAR
jgi:Ser/Thr protein kinase RdoA (MazF antagonist)